MERYKWYVLLLAALAVASMNLSVDTKFEFEGPIHQLYIDHRTHHQIDLMQHPPGQSDFK